jgi:hypothetical protein
LLGSAIALAVLIAVVFFIAARFQRTFDSYIRQQTVDYLSRRFQSDVQIGSLRVEIPPVSKLRLLLTHGKGIIAQVTGENIVLRQTGKGDAPPMFKMGRFHLEVDLGKVFDPVKKIALVQLEQVEIRVPPKGERPGYSNPEMTTSGAEATPVLLERVILTDSRLFILPRIKDRQPLEFDLHRVVLESVAARQSMNYQATLTNPKPPGLIQATGTFGPWDAGSPSDTPLTGDYSLRDADLGVFNAIEGTLQSQGSFQGTLSSISAKGEAEVPDFRLRMAGRSVPLHTSFEALVDGTNGNTVLKPVRARLGSTAFTTSGAVLKHDGDANRSIDLDVHMPNGEVLDLLKLTMKNKPFLAGRIDFNARIRIPPLQSPVIEKLVLDGQFNIRRGQFLVDSVQDKVDTLSRRGQGQPADLSIANVFSDMSGAFHLANQSIRFQFLTFGAPGAKVDLAGVFDFAHDNLDFDGSLRLDAKVSQTMTGWKRWALKPIDPILAKKGAGTFLKIKVTGSSKEPKFQGSR